MKRNISLVQYASSSDDDSSHESSSKISQPPPKRRKTLPVLAAAIAGPVHVDNPALHDGRIRTAPHIDGQFAAYIYVPVKIDQALLSFLQDTLRKGRTIFPSLHSIPKNLDDLRSTDLDAELHISLSRPVYIRSHQREELKKAVRRIAKSRSPFEASFSVFSELQNDEKTRTFLTIEIGAGHNELRLMSESLVPILRRIRQKEFYTDPRFHASIGWALMLQNPTSIAQAVAVAEGSPLASKVPNEANDTPDAQLPTVSSLPRELVTTLQKEFGTALLTRSIGRFSVESLCVKIGKDTTRWALSSD